MSIVKQFISRFLNITSEENESTNQPFKYCPQCGDEYRTDFVTCGICKVSLESTITEPESTATTQQFVNSQDAGEASGEMVVIKAGSLADMKGAARILQQANINALLSPKDRPGAKCCGGQVMYLHVDRLQLREAVKILHHHYLETTGLVDGAGSSEGVGESLVFDTGTCVACGHELSDQDTNCPGCGLYVRMEFDTTAS